MDNRNKKPSNRGKVMLYQLASFALTIAILSLIGIAFKRPTFSKLENRELAKFPKLTISSLFSGDFFDGFNAWYSDTYFGRETLVGWNTKIEEHYGIKSKNNDTAQIYGEVVKGDEIPDAYDPNAVVEDETEASYDKIEANGDSQSLGAVFVVGDRAFEYYNFSQSQANKYITTINGVADNLSGKVKVYDIIVPTSIEITLPDEYRGKINSSDQAKAIDYINSGLNGNVVKVPIYNTLMSHRSEYIYFNTDHHWTSLGAYYAYDQFAQKAGIATHSLAEYEKVEFSGFLGSFYRDTKKLPVLEKNPDTIIAYKPNADAKLVYTDSNGKQKNWPIINDVNKYAKTEKYSCFIAGDQSYEEITNPNITDGSSIIVIKESFGNALVPFLVENYETIYVIDYRYYKGSVTKLATEKGVDSVLYINNVSAIRNADLMSKLGKIS